MLPFLGLLSALLAGVFSVYFLQKFCFPYFWRDLTFLLKAIKYGARLELLKHSSTMPTVMGRFVQQAQRIPNKPFVICEGRALTYREVDERSNRLAHVLLGRSSLEKGDCVALLMSNEPDFVCVWFALVKIGCSVAFLNTNIRSKSLLHCIHCCGAKALIVGSDLVECLDGIFSNLQEQNIQVWTVTDHSENTLVHTLLDKIDVVSHHHVPAKLRAAKSLKSPILYIFTSGTTGFPKAAVITHLQCLKAAGGFWLFGATKDDVIYIPLPLYHSAASLIGIGGTIELGATCVLKKKFSSSQFWNDCRKYNVTVFQYIGELCRYLCNQPKTEADKVHKVRMAVGNGLQQDVWREFQRRFGNIRIYEFYGSTEGNLCLMNHIGKIGTVGRSNFIYKFLFKYDLVKYDMEKEEPVKDQRGFCQRAGTGETGLLLSKVSSLTPFFGYKGSKQQTEKKLMKSVFVKGDTYVNTGDLMAEDREGFICFRDRLGDTFRCSCRLSVTFFVDTDKLLSVMA